MNQLIKKKKNNIINDVNFITDSNLFCLILIGNSH